MLVNIKINPLINDIAGAVQDSYLCDNPTLRNSDISGMVHDFFQAGSSLDKKIIVLHGFAEAQVIYNALELYRRSYNGENEYHAKLIETMFEQYHEDYIKE